MPYCKNTDIAFAEARNPAQSIAIRSEMQRNGIGHGRFMCLAEIK